VSLTKAARMLALLEMQEKSWQLFLASLNAGGLFMFENPFM